MCQNTRARCVQIEPDRPPISLILSMILSEKSATFPDHALADFRNQVAGSGSGRSETGAVGTSLRTLAIPLRRASKLLDGSEVENNVGRVFADPQRIIVDEVIRWHRQIVGRLHVLVAAPREIVFRTMAWAEITSGPIF